MVSKKTDHKQPPKTSSSRAPKKKVAQSKTKCAHRHAPKDKTIDIVNELKIKNTELERFASFPRLNPNPVLEVNSSGKITFINNAAKNILRKLNVKGDGVVFLPEDVDTILKELKHKKRKGFYREITIRERVFGERLYLTPEFHAVRIYAHDITDKKKIEVEIGQAEISLIKERDFTSAVLSTAGALVIVLDLKGRIVSFNKTCELVTGYSFDEVKGKPFWDFLLVPEEIKPVKSVFKELKAGQFPNKHENYWVAKDGNRYLISWTNTALFNTQGDVEFIIGTGIDITERKRAEEALRESGEDLKRAQAVAKTGSWRMNVQKDELLWSEENHQIFGIPRGIPMTYETFLSTVHPDDRAYVDRKWTAALRGEHYDIEHRIVVKGREKWVRERAELEFDKDGSLLGGFGTTQDITGRKLAEENLKKAKDALQKANEELERRVLERTGELKKAYEIVATERQRLFSVLEQIPAYVCLLTADYKFAYVNQEFKRCFGDPGDRHCHEHLFSRQKPCEICQTFRVFAEQNAQQWEWTGPDGNTYAIFDYPFTDIDGSSLIMELGIDITQRKIAEDELKESREKLRNLYAHLQLAVEAERTKIAREIHDEFGTILTALNIDLSWLQKKLPGDQHTLIERIKKDVELINSAIKVVQRISSELRPGVLDYLGLSSAVEWQVKEFGNRTGIDWDISIDMKMSDLNKDISIALFRILQEALTNIARYAEAAKIRVSLVEVDSVLTLDVTDDGKGISEEQLSDPHSLGILGMRERVQYLGGNIDIIGVPNKGTRITVRVPLAKQGYER